MRVAYSNWDRTKQKYTYFKASGLLNSEQQCLRKPSFEDALFLNVLNININVVVDLYLKKIPKSLT